jgi:hypothetical protein
MPMALLQLLPQVQNATQFSTIKFESSTSFFLFHNVQSQRSLVIIHFKTQISDNVLHCVEQQHLQANLKSLNCIKGAVVFFLGTFVCTEVAIIHRKM